MLVRDLNQKCGIADPAITTTQRLIDEVNDRVRREFLGLQQHAQLRVRLAHFALEDLFNCLAVVTAFEFVGDNPWEVNKAHVLHVLRPNDKEDGLRAECVGFAQSHVVLGYGTEHLSTYLKQLQKRRNCMI